MSLVPPIKLVSTAAEVTTATTGVGASGLAAPRLNVRDARTIAGRRNLLHAFEVHLCAAIVEQRAQFSVLRVAKIALCLHDEEVRGETNLKAALLGFETLLREFPRDLCGLQPLAIRFDEQGRVGDLSGDLKFEC